MPVKLKPCDCKSAYQDKTYGKQNRVHNTGTKKVICTVCAKETRND